jgi:hypothetical protein
VRRGKLWWPYRYSGISESLMYGGKTVECMESGRLLRDILKVILMVLR